MIIMDPWSVSNITIEVIIAIVAAVGNGMVLFVIARNHKLQTFTNVLICSLATADMVVGLVGIPCVIVTLFGLPHNFYGCLLMNCAIIICTQVSIFNLLSVAIERFIAIKHPFFYQQHFSLRTAIAFVCVNWMLGIIVGLVPLFGWNLGWNELNLCNFVWIIDFNYRVYFTYFGFILTPLFIMLIIYIYIFTIVRKQARVIASLEVAGNAGTDKALVKKEMKAARKFSLVIGFFALCWIPLDALNAIGMWTGKICLPCIYITVWLSHLNSALNPLLYAYGNSLMRKALKNTILCRLNKVQDEGDSTYITEAK